MFRVRREQEPPYVTGVEVAKMFRERLTRDERSEILMYPKVYYYGQHMARRPSRFQHNIAGDKYSDASGLYAYVIQDHIGYRYEIVKLIGKGGSGIVLECFDHKFRRFVAIKVINRFHDHANKETFILELIRLKKGTKCATKLYEHFIFRCFKFIVMERLTTDLQHYLLWHKYHGVGIDMVSKIGYNLFKCLHVLHDKCRIVHCDVKPENILFVNKGKSTIKLSDFGTSCRFKDLSPTCDVTTTRYYRAPEVILYGIKSSKIDIWAAGCVLAEMFSGEPLFFGEDERDQLGLIIGTLDMPTERFIDDCAFEAVHKFFHSDGFPRYCRRMVSADGKVGWEARLSPSGLERYAPGANPLPEALTGELDPELLFLNLLEKCLEWDPVVRISANDALRHPFFKRRVPGTVNAIGEYPQHCGPQINLFETASETVVQKLRRPKDRCLTSPF